MALRVLLADESSTIKKVFQLALQDFAVDVRPVNIGLDVLTVAKSFQPDIIFADVLLQKKNGYDVCAELKTDVSTKQTPVVLMWSGFMELDEDKFQASLANGQLEKPFDVAALRKLVGDLVPKTGSQRLSQFLSFPKMPELQEPEKATPPKVLSDEDFMQVPIPKMKSGADRFRINIDGEGDLDMPVSLKLPTDPITVNKILKEEAEEAEQFSIRPSNVPKSEPQGTRAAPTPQVRREVAEPSLAPAQPERAHATIPKLTEEDIENIVRNQAKEMIEAVVWRVLPDLAQQIIEREIEKLLKEKDAGIYR